MDTFEQFLNKQYKTMKCFGVDGAEAAVMGVNAVIRRAAAPGADECVIGMPHHRGRLNVLTNVVAKTLVQMFAEFDGTHHDFDSIVERSEPDDWPFAGDVKHHFGTSYVRPFLNGKSATVTPEANPLHLETVNTVALGRARAKQHYLGSTPETRKHVTPVLLHGDASFAGQSVFCEGMQLAHVQECFGVEGTPPRSSRTRTAALGTAADVGCAGSSGKTGGVQLALPPSGGCFGALGVAVGEQRSPPPSGGFHATASTSTWALGRSADVRCAGSSGRTGGDQHAPPPSGGCFGAPGATGGELRSPPPSGGYHAKASSSAQASRGSTMSYNIKELWYWQGLVRSIPGRTVEEIIDGLADLDVMSDEPPSDLALLRTVANHCT